MSSALFSRDLSDSEDDEQEQQQQEELPQDQPQQPFRDVLSQKEGQEMHGLILQNEASDPVDNLQQEMKQIDLQNNKPEKRKYSTDIKKRSVLGNEKYVVDNLILELLELTDEYSSRHEKLQKNLSDGFFHLSQAKYKQSSFSRAFPTTKDIRAEFEANIRISSETAEPEDLGPRDSGDELMDSVLIEVPSDDDEDEGVRGWKVAQKVSGENYLLNFHGMPSTMLKRGQQDFIRAIESEVTGLALLKQRVELLCRQIEEAKSGRQ